MFKKARPRYLPWIHTIFVGQMLRYYTIQSDGTEVTLAHFDSNVSDLVVSTGRGTIVAETWNSSLAFMKVVNSEGSS